MKEDNISQLDDYDVPFYEPQYTRGSCCISLVKLKLFDEFNTPKLSKILDIYFSCGTIVLSSKNGMFRRPSKPSAL